MVADAHDEGLLREVVVVSACNRAIDPQGYREHPKTRLLRRILDLIETEIPRDPGAYEYSLGNTLGPAHRHRRRAKFLGRKTFDTFEAEFALLV